MAYLQIEAKQTTKKLSILCVEDDPDILRILKETLSQEFRVLTTENGKDALQLIEKETPDMVFNYVKQSKSMTL